MNAPRTTQRPFRLVEAGGVHVEDSRHGSGDVDSWLSGRSSALECLDTEVVACRLADADDSDRPRVRLLVDSLLLNLEPEGCPRGVERQVFPCHVFVRDFLV